LEFPFSPQTKHLKHHLVHPGSPSVYRLVPKRRTTTGTWTRITVTDRKPHQSNKTMVLVGETGTGKSTLINAVFNYVQGVTWEDDVWFEIADKDKTSSQSDGQTRTVTVYEMCGGGTVDLCVTVVDTPGYGDTRGVDRDQHITTGFLDLLCSHEGVDGVDLVGVVLKATDNRLSDRLLYVWDSVTSLFGKDLDRNMVALISHSDGMKPEDALRALEDAHVPLSKDQNQEPLYFLFNNRQTTPRQKRTVRHLQSSWQTSTDGLKELMDFMHKREPQNLKTTLEVLQERIRLESCIRKLKERNEAVEIQQTLIQQNHKDVKTCEEEMEKNLNFILEFQQVYKDIKDLNFYEAVCCLRCEETCHSPCPFALKPSCCKVMKDGNCGVCSGRCPASDHVKKPWKYVEKVIRVKRTDEERKTRYEQNKAEMEKKMSLLEDLEKNLEELTSNKHKSLHEAYGQVLHLDQIALNVDSLSTYVHLDFLIQKMKETGDAEKVQKLEEMEGRINERTKAGLSYMKKKIGSMETSENY
uniref:AAA+ ATPase domain-containing protein n=1 Tax=Sphaeramia orbicularis TaxID=375764 RepID=A0A673B9W4_9TELE